MIKALQAEAQPAVTICIPTVRRPRKLLRAVGSALAQDYPNLTVVVSDDEPQPNESTQMLERHFGHDPRLRIVRNTRAPGFVGNTNNALLAGTGEWLKLLHDDDVLEPDCVSTLMEGARAYPEARLLRCGVNRYFDGALVRPFQDKGRPLFTAIPQRRMAAAAYMRQDVGEALPTAQCVHRSAIEAGILFEDQHTMPLMVESCWNVRLYQRAPVLIVNRALAQWHQGDHDTMTSHIELDELDRQIIAFRAFCYDYVDNKQAVAPLGVTQDFIRLLRALARLKEGHVAACARHVLAVRHPEAFLLLARHRLKRIAAQDGFGQAPVEPAALPSLRREPGYGFAGASQA